MPGDKRNSHTTSFFILLSALVRLTSFFLTINMAMFLRYRKLFCQFLLENSFKKACMQSEMHHTVGYLVDALTSKCLSN